MKCEIDGAEFADFLDAVAMAAHGDEPSYLSGQLTAFGRAMRRHIEADEGLWPIRLNITTMTDAVKAGRERSDVEA